MNALTPDSLPESLAIKVSVDSAGCWLWRASSGRYARTYWRGRMVNVHRLTYHLLVDSALALSPGRSSDKVLDHLCRVTSCVNPAHLEVVDMRTNALRGRNGALTTHSSSFPGVAFDRRNQRWQSQVAVGRQQIHLGRFLDEHDAARAYSAALTLLGTPLPALSPEPTNADIAAARSRLARKGVVR